MAIWRGVDSSSAVGKEACPPSSSSWELKSRWCRRLLGSAMRQVSHDKGIAPGSLIFGLRRRLVVLVIVTIIPILGLIIYDAAVEYREGIAEVRKEADHLVEITSARQMRFIDSARHLLELLAELPEVRNGNAESCRRLMTKLIRSQSGYANLGVIGSDGNIWCSGIEFSGSVNAAERAYFRRAMTTKAFGIGNYQIGEISKKGSLHFGYPIVDEAGDVRNVVFAALSLSWLTQLAGETRLPQAATLSILDSEGTILARLPEPDKWLGQPVPDAPLFQIVQLRSQAATEVVGSDRVARLYAYNTLGNKSDAGQIYVLVGIPKDAAFAKARGDLIRNMAWLVLVAAVALAAAWVAARKFVVGYVDQHAQAEEARFRLASIVESSEDAIIGKTLDGTIISWNNGAEIMYGYAAAEIVGRSASILYPPDRSNEILAILEQIRRGKGVNRYEAERVRKDGRRFYVSASVSPIRDREGKVFGASTISRDITALREAEEAMLQMNTKLRQEIEERQRAEKSLADFTAMVVHDLRSPLSNMASIAESLRDGFFGSISEEQQKWLERIENNSRALIDQVTDFLDLSKIEAGHIEINKRPVDLCALVHENVIDYSTQADKKNILLTTQVEGNLPAIHLDSRRIGQVFGNLCANALKFTAPGGRIEVGARRLSREEVLLWVNDTGIGIPQEEIGQIFEKYRQLSTGKSSSYQGTGLGLVICRKIIEAHGGKIWAESKEGQGTGFFFTLST
jgi:PAS domain S-box-containing protein